MEKEIRIKEAVSADLAIRVRADAFLDQLERLPAREIVVDFSQVKSISRSFAHQYQLRKKASKKKIRESNVPAHVAKMFNVVQSSSHKTHLVDSNSMPLMTI